MNYDYASIEAKWQKYWEENDTFHTDVWDFSRPKYYVLDMFSYPSGVGQHGRAEIVDRVIEGIRRVDIGLADIQMIDLLAGCRCCHCVRMEFTHGGLAACKCFAGQLHMNRNMYERINC